MGVDVQRERGHGVAQQVLDALNVRTAGNGYGCRRVSEVVGARIRAANAGGNDLEPSVKRIDMAARNRGISSSASGRISLCSAFGSSAASQGLAPIIPCFKATLNALCIMALVFLTVFPDRPARVMELYRR